MPRARMSKHRSLVTANQDTMGMAKHAQVNFWNILFNYFSLSFLLPPSLSPFVYSSFGVLAFCSVISLKVFCLNFFRIRPKMSCGYPCSSSLYYLFFGPEFSHHQQRAKWPKKKKDWQNKGTIQWPEQFTSHWIKSFQGLSKKKKKISYCSTLVNDEIVTAGIGCIYEKRYCLVCGGAIVEWLGRTFLGGCRAHGHIAD